MQSQITSITWTVPSASDPGSEYTVSAPALAGLLSCTCKAEQYPKTRGRCWHIKAARSGLAGKPRVRLSVRPARRPVSALYHTTAAELEV